jgi:hypothetical protein
MQAASADGCRHGGAGCGEDYIEVLCLVSTANQKLLGLIKSQTVMRIGRIISAMATPMVCEGPFLRSCCVRVVCMRHCFLCSRPSSPTCCMHLWSEVENKTFNQDTHAHYLHPYR